MKKQFITLILASLTAVGAAAQGNGSDYANDQSAQNADSLAIIQQEVADIRARLNAQEQQIAKNEEKERLKKVWGKGRYFNIGYGFGAHATQDDFKFNSSWSFSLSKGTSYLFPSTPFFNMLKVGFDMRWFDLTATSYKKNVDYVGNGSFFPDFSDYWDDDDYYWDDEPWDEEEFNIGHYDISIGAFGVGPVVSVAPFSNFGNSLRSLRATAYFHYQPTYTLHLMSEDGDMELSGAYCNMFDIGLKIQWRWIGLGLEHKWGSGKFSNFVDDDEFDYDYEYDDAPSKVKRKLGSTRLYISFTF